MKACMQRHLGTAEISKTLTKAVHTVLWNNENKYSHTERCVSGHSDHCRLQDCINVNGSHFEYLKQNSIYARAYKDTYDGGHEK
jgi:hypothetical protein